MKPVEPLDALMLGLCAFKPIRVPGRGRVARSGIAVVLADTPAPCLLLTRRARRKGDPWSGDMAFPGGGMEPHDQDVKTAATRECREETGIDLASHGKVLGRLSDVPTRTHGRLRPMVVTPIVFSVSGVSSFTLSAEVEEALWIPLEFFLNPNNRKPILHHFAGRQWRIPCYDFQGRCVWGLTLIVLDELLALARGQSPGWMSWARRLAHRV